MTKAFPFGTLRQDVKSGKISATAALAAVKEARAGRPGQVPVKVGARILAWLERRVGKEAK